MYYNECHYTKNVSSHHTFSANTLQTLHNQLNTGTAVNEIQDENTDSTHYNETRQAKHIKKREYILTSF